MRLGSLLVVGLALVALGATTVAAQPAPKTATEQSAEEAARSQADAKMEAALSKLTIKAPAGWMAGRAPAGSVALFRSIGEDKGQIEIKATAGLDARQAKVFFKSFDVNLQRVGAKRLYAPKSETIGTVKGKIVEYTITSSDKPYRLLLFKVHRGRVAWLVAGFFEERLKGSHSKAMRSLIATVPFDAAP